MPGSVPDAVEAEHATRDRALIEALGTQVTELRAAVAHLQASGSVPAAAQLAELSQRAAMFAIDYLSWSEEDPRRRAAALAEYLSDGAETNPDWPGAGCQRATDAIPGAVTSDGDTTWVDVRVHVTPYEKRERHGTSDIDDEAPAPISSSARQLAEAEPEPSGQTVGEDAAPTRRPSSAPAPNPKKWAALDSEWSRLKVPVRRLPDGRLVIDLAAAEPDHTIDRQGG